MLRRLGTIKNLFTLNPSLVHSLPNKTKQTQYLKSLTCVKYETYKSEPIKPTNSYYPTMGSHINETIKNNDIKSTISLIKNGAKIMDNDKKLLSDLLDKDNEDMLRTLASEYPITTTLCESWALLMPKLAEKYISLYTSIKRKTNDSFEFNEQQMIVAIMNGNIEYMKDRIIHLDSIYINVLTPYILQTSTKQKILIRGLIKAVEYNHSHIVMYLIKNNDAVLAGIDEAFVAAARHNNLHIARYLASLECINLNYNKNEALKIVRNRNDIDFMKMMEFNGAKLEDEDMKK